MPAASPRVAAPRDAVRAGDGGGGRPAHEEGRASRCRPRRLRARARSAGPQGPRGRRRERRRVPGRRASSRIRRRVRRPLPESATDPGRAQEGPPGGALRPRGPHGRRPVADAPRGGAGGLPPLGNLRLRRPAGRALLPTLPLGGHVPGARGVLDAHRAIHGRRRARRVHGRRRAPDARDELRARGAGHLRAPARGADLRVSPARPRRVLHGRRAGARGDVAAGVVAAPAALLRPDFLRDGRRPLPVAGPLQETEAAGRLLRKIFYDRAEADDGGRLRRDVRPRHAGYRPRARDVRAGGGRRLARRAFGRVGGVPRRGIRQRIDQLLGRARVVRQAGGRPGGVGRGGGAAGRSRRARRTSRALRRPREVGAGV
mmetsp:Transcript_30210/g.102668  ORF Transcript_30210/g.102668 Transcript_30210/m.102668 type:complete len:373 (-) Transcript_30210:70-1188(-)